MGEPWVSSLRYGRTSSRRRRSRRPRTLASTRSEPAWRIIPPIRSGSTERVASTVRPEDCSISRRSRAPRRRRARRRSSARPSGGPARGRRSPRTPRRSAASGRRGPSRRRGGRSCGRSGRRPPSPRRGRSPSRPGRAAGWRGTPRAPGIASSASASSASWSRATSTRSWLARGLEQGARVHAVRDRHQLFEPSRAEKSRPCTPPR